MFEWKIDELGDESVPRQLQRQPRWYWLCLLTLFVAVVLIVGQRWWANDQALRQALQRIVAAEDQAMRFGTADHAVQLGDPNASAAWQHCYAMQMGRVDQSVPPPTMGRVDQRSSWVQVKLHYPAGRYPDVYRIYRLFNGEWRRASLRDSPWAATDSASSHLILANEGVSFALRNDLDKWQDHLAERWPYVNCPDCDRTIVVFPVPTASTILDVDQATICLNDPAFARQELRSPLSEEQQGDLAQLIALAMALTTPETIPFPSSSAGGSGDLLAATPMKQWHLLLMLLQEAEAQRWALNEGDLLQLRNAWRAEVNYEWFNPFDEPLPYFPAYANDSARARFQMVRLLVARRVVVPQDTQGVTPLVKILFTFDPSSFSLEGFFTALIGGSTYDLEQLNDGYIQHAE